MSGETIPDSEKKLSPDEVVALKAQFRDRDGQLNQLATQVCGRIVDGKADRIEAEMGRRPGHEAEWKLANTMILQLTLQHDIDAPGSDWPTIEGSPPEEFAIALSEVQTQATAEERRG